MSETVTRRRLLVVGNSTAAALAFGGCALIRGGARHPVLEQKQQRLEGNTLVIPLAALASVGPGEAIEVKPGGAHPDLLVRHDGGGWQAITAHCTHRGCVVDWNLTAAEWQCPCHGSRYAADGHVLKGPAERALVVAPAEVRGESLVVDISGLAGSS
jgi:Rieske Fe-S protein